MSTTGICTHPRPGALRRRAAVPAVAALALLLAAAPRAEAAVELGGKGKDAKAKLSADFRLRFEADWDSQNASGVARDDRTGPASGCGSASR